MVDYAAPGVSFVYLAPGSLTQPMHYRASGIAQPPRTTQHITGTQPFYTHNSLDLVNNPRAALDHLIVIG